MEAIDYYHAATNIIFLPATESQPNKIKFFHDGNNSYSYVGMIQGTQNLSIGMFSGTTGTVLHELGHAVGLYHEHTKKNRDNYINVNLDNLAAADRADFSVDPYQIYDNPFDFGSIMLYSSTAGSINASPVLTRKDGTTWIAQREKLSAGDFNMLKTFYQYKEGNVRSLKIQTHENNGAGICVADINNNGIQDMILTCTDMDASNGNMNRSMCYQIFYDMDYWGNPKSVSKFFWPFSISQSSTQNFDTSVAVTNLNSNSLPEIVFMYTKGAKSTTKDIVYRIAFDVNADGSYSWLSGEMSTPGFGHVSAGLGLDIYDFNKNGKPDMIFTVYDDPNGQNAFSYRIAYDLNENGSITGGTATGWIDGLGHYGQGAGVTVADINKNGKPDIMLMAVDAPSGLNYINYKILWDVNQSGQPTSSQNYYLRQSFTTSIGNDHQGGDCVLKDINNDGKLDCIFMVLDNPSLANSWRYFTGFNIAPTGNFELWGKPNSTDY